MTGFQTTAEHSFLASVQRRVVFWMIPKLPAALSPSDLTRLSLLGALIAASALILCRWRADAVYVVPFGVLLNWIGAILDGPLARHRPGGSKSSGLAEHLTDLASLSTMIVAYAFSPFLPFEAAIIILTCFLLFSAYANLRAAAGRVEPMALIGVSAAEFRLILAFWPFFARGLGDGGAAVVTTVTGILAVVAAFALLLKILGDAQKIAAAGKD